MPAADAGLVWLELGRLQARVLDRPRPAIDSYEKARVRRPDEGEDRSARACCERVVEGLEVTRLPRGAHLLPAPTSPA